MVTFFHNLAAESNGINPLKPSGYYRYHQFLTFNHSTFCQHSVLMFFVDLKTNSDYFPIQH
jgi:hypothetical protein